EDEMEIGIGIHGEPGRERMKLEPADRIVDRLLEPVLSDLPFNSGDRVLAFVNGMGGTPQIELYVAMRRVGQALSEGGYKLERTLVGSYITSLEMAGLSITLLRLDDDLVRLWDAPVLALIGSGGGAGGPLYGTFFLRMGQAATGKEGLTIEDLRDLLRAGLEGVVQRGKASPGDKTMVDALTPAVEALDAAISAGRD